MGKAVHLRNKSMNEADPEDGVLGRGCGAAGEKAKRESGGALILPQTQCDHGKLFTLSGPLVQWVEKPLPILPLLR